MLRLFKVSGDSLEPVYRPGDFVLVCTLPGVVRRIRPGDAIVFQHAAYGTLIKIVRSVSADRETCEVTGLKAESVDSRQFGPVHRSRIRGKVVARIPKGGGDLPQRSQKEH